MADADDITDAIAESATAPKRVQVGSHSVEAQPIADQIAARNDVAAQAAKRNDRFGIHTRTFRPYYQ